MEIHSVLPEERARDPKGETLPWAYRTLESVLPLTIANDTDPPYSSARLKSDESGAFGRHRSLRATGSRTSRSRAGTTPVRQKENPAVTEFGRIFATEQAREDDVQDKHASANTDTSRPVEPEGVPTECLLYGYAGKSVEWKVLSRFEKIVAPSIICEDYPREDPDLFLSTNSPLSFSRSAVTVHKNLSRDALRKSRVYKGGNHWIKITFDSYQAAERACFYSPLEMDGYMIYCEMWDGRGPTADVPILKGSETAKILSRNDSSRSRTLPPSQAAQFVAGKDSAIAGFERVMNTLPRSHLMPDTQYGQPGTSTQDDISVIESTTASSATAMEPSTPIPLSDLRSRSVPHLPSQITPDPTSQFMTHIPSARKLTLRPISEALPKQPSFTERILGSLPIVSWFIGKGIAGDFISEGALLRDDGTWDVEKNGWYWRFWHWVDGWFGTDFCALKED
jgi:hypothetical protein